MVNSACNVAIADIDDPWDMASMPDDVYATGVHAFGVYFLEQAPDSFASDHASCPIYLQRGHAYRLSVDCGGV